tara:strand:- start:148 stop:456 length:309 start_codon:yes stop_codon:yes gene_type:complete
MKKILLIIFLSCFVVSCQSAKDALTLKKKSSGDEFLVEKKSPLVLPPDYGKLPVPVDEKIIEDETKNEDIENIISNNKSLVVTSEKNSNPTSIEKSVLDKIK